MRIGVHRVVPIVLHVRDQICLSVRTVAFQHLLHPALYPAVLGSAGISMCSASVHSPESGCRPDADPVLKQPVSATAHPPRSQKRPHQARGLPHSQLRIEA